MHALPAIDIEKLPRDVDALLGVIADLHSQYATILDSLHAQLAKLRRMHFGASSERLPGQADLFCEKLELPVPPEARETITYERARSKGRPKLPADLPRSRIDYDLSEQEKSEFERLTRIGEEVSETLDFTPAKLSVIEHVRAKYRCEKEGASTIRVAAAEPSPIAKSNASAGLLAHVLVSKYADGLPLNRQERIFRRHGLELSRATLCDWALMSTELLARLLQLLKLHVLRSPVVFGDDTTLDLILGGRGAVCTARLWAYVSAGAVRDPEGDWRDYPKAAYFEFTETREAIHPTRFLAGYTGYLQADDYAGYHATFRTGRVIHVACWAHYLECRFMRSSRPSASLFTSLRFGQRTPHNPRHCVDVRRRVGERPCRSHCARNRVLRRISQAASGVMPAYSRVPCIPRAAAASLVMAAMRA